MTLEWREGLDYPSIVQSRNQETIDNVYHGVDFSGAKRPRRKIWGSTWNGREAATTRSGFSHDELVEEIRRSAHEGRRHLWLIDAPFNLPAELLELHGVALDWHASIEWLASFESPRQWRRACRKVSRVEHRREIDRRVHTPFAPLNLRMFKQTWHCMVSVLRPLFDETHVVILPMGLVGRDEQSLEQARVWLGEACPSSILRARGWPHSGYKGPSDSNRATRQELVTRLEAESGIAVSSDARRAAIDDPEADALDSLLLLAAGPNFARTDHGAILREDQRSTVEGWVYV